MVPHSTDLDLETHNGGITISDVRGRIRFDALNGGVTVSIPRNYSAQLETRTVNGGINVNFPVTVQGRIGRSLDVRLGEGGRTVRAVTTNGGVNIVRGASRQIR